MGDQNWRWLWSNHKKLLAGKSDVRFKELLGAFLGRIKGWRLKTDLQVRGDSDMIQRRQGQLQAGYRGGKGCWAWLSWVPLNWLHFHKSVLQVLQEWEKEAQRSEVACFRSHSMPETEGSQAWVPELQDPCMQPRSSLSGHQCLVFREVRIQDLHES